MVCNWIVTGTAGGRRFHFDRTRPGLAGRADATSGSNHLIGDCRREQRDGRFHSPVKRHVELEGCRAVWWCGDGGILCRIRYFQTSVASSILDHLCIKDAGDWILDDYASKQIRERLARISAFPMGDPRQRLGGGLAELAGHLGGMVDYYLDYHPIVVFTLAGLADTLARAGLNQRLPAQNIQKIFAWFVISLVIFILVDKIRRFSNH